MYSEKRSVLQLVALLKAHGITEVVLTPGSRNAPLIHSLATDKDFTCYSIVDERSAGFFALGVIQAHQRPVAVCCTSGTAALNMGPAVAEAFYQQLPLLVITADRPPAWIGQMDGQTIPQTGLFGELVRHSVQLPEVNNREEEWHCNRLINEAILSLNNGIKGPAHINIPLSEPLFGFHAETLPAVRVIRRSGQKHIIPEEDRYAERFLSYSKRMVIVGQLPPENELAAYLTTLSEQHGIVVLADRLSNIPSKDSFPFDVVLRSAPERDLEELMPELVVTIGGHIVSKRLKQFIRSAPLRELWHISPAGEVIDTFQQVTDIVKSDPGTFLRYLAEIPPHPSAITAYKDRWNEASRPVTKPEAGYSDLHAVGRLLQQLPEESSLHLANSHSAYLPQLFDIPSTVHVFCNRGTNGIEGSLSTAVGYAAASRRLTFLLTGDLSFFYDMNGLWNNHLSPNLRVLVNNNGGGGIFHTLPGLNASEALDAYVSAEHTTEARPWAEQRGFTYLSARNAEELQHQWPLFVNRQSNRPVLLEVFTSMEENKKQVTSYYQQQKTRRI